VYETELGDPFWMRIRKTYTLGPKDYHVGLAVEFERLPQGQKGKGQLRVQVSGPRGLPIEGEWYTSTYRSAMVGWLDKKGTLRRGMEDSVGIGVKRGGDAVLRGENTFKYAAIFTQYFTSALAVDDTAEGAAKNPWSFVRATTELPFDQPQDPNRPYFDDITIRAVTDPLDLDRGEKVTHKYLIYNGPSKVRLLNLLKDEGGAERAVDKELVDRYLDRLGLRTLTDYRSPTWLGAFADAIYWTDLVIACTNLMHWLLAIIHAIVPSWGLSIIGLTVMVRLILLVPSKKQTAMNVRMMEIQKRLKPELDKLHEKYKDDFHRFNQEKTRLMMQHGVNPFVMMGGCLLLLAQMPIMMGLYFGLQESIFFRLDRFLWVENLAAPDMLVWWSERIPWISSPESIGNFYYLGPFLNLLPLLAVGLMLYQQHKMMPPPTDEQAAAQQKMMKWMMILVAVMFYKVAAGLALYFIVSTTWGLVERKLVPKPKEGDAGGTGAKLPPKDGSPNGTPAAPPKPPGFFGRLRERMREKMEELQRQAQEQSSRQLKKDRDPNRPAPIRNPAERRDKDKKKKRRK
jgi:YidC/Oxa1 family membrane protein insertase